MNIYVICDCVSVQTLEFGGVLLDSASCSIFSSIHSSIYSVGVDAN